MRCTEIIDIVLNSILGLAIVILTWRTILLTRQSMKQEEKRRSLETDIALFEKRFEVLRFLNSIVYDYDDNKYNSAVYHNMVFSAEYLFPEPIGKEIGEIFEAILEYYKNDKEPTKYIERYAENKRMKNQSGKTRILQAFYEEYTHICAKCSLFMRLAKNYKVEFPDDFYKE
jgi:hypothetical protein